MRMSNPTAKSTLISITLAPLDHPRDGPSRSGTFPWTKIAIGPPIDDGFYYDFDCPHPFTPDDLPKIEARMREIVAGIHAFVMSTHSSDESKTYWGERGKIQSRVDRGFGNAHRDPLHPWDLSRIFAAAAMWKPRGRFKHFKLTKIAGPIGEGRKAGTACNGFTARPGRRRKN
jgi:threonyl-tRNA synthetase